MSTPDVTVVKIGGAALRAPGTVAALARRLAAAHFAGRRLVLVHGGGPAINEALTRRGLAWTFLEGQRVTTAAMMATIEEALAGRVNGELVAALGAAGVPVRSFNAARSGLLESRPAGAALGRVGVVERAQADPLHADLRAGRVPVIAPLGSGPEGETLNVNADWAAAHLAVALGARELVFHTDRDGILDGGGRAILRADTACLRELVENGIVTGGMLTKVRAVSHALEHGVERVIIRNAAAPRAGTVCELVKEALDATI